MKGLDAREMGGDDAGASLGTYITSLMTNDKCDKLVASSEARFTSGDC